MGAIDDRRLLIVGASARAAAWSAIRAGFRPVCIDLFADEDLRAVADVLPIERYPQDALRAAARLPDSVPWMYTGAIENRPGLIAAMSRERPLLGCAADRVKAVRALTASAAHELPGDSPRGCFPVRLPDVRVSANPPPPDGSWMLKPRRSAAGRGIVVWDRNAVGHPTLGEPHSFQRRIDGTPISAVCLAAAHGGTIVGVSRQWIGEPICGATGFQYCGSIGPMTLPESVRAAIAGLAERLTARFPLRGLFGCDLILNHEAVWLIEVNPRYTASVEVFEFARGESLLADHVAACRPDLFPTTPKEPGSRIGFDSATTVETDCVGKAVLYAGQELTAPTLPVVRFHQSGERPEIADVPRAGTVISTGTPICTVFAHGATMRDCEALLRDCIHHWSSRIAQR